MVFSSIRRRLSTIRTSGLSSTTSTTAEVDAIPAERLVLIYGNCQAHWLGGLLAAQGVGLVAIVGQPFGFHPEFQGVRPYFVSTTEAASLATEAKMAGRQVTLLEQTSPLNPGLDDEVRKLGSHVLQFPHLEMRAYWHPWLTQVGDGFNHDRIRRQFQFDLAAIRRSEAKADWDSALSEHIAQSHTRTAHFYTLNHPTADLMQRLHAHICAGLEVRGPLDREMYDWAQAEVAMLAGMGFIAQHPLHGSVVDALGLEWARRGWYGLWSQAYFDDGSAGRERPLNLLQLALNDPEHDPHVYSTLGTLLRASGDHDGAARAFGRAHRAYPQNPEYARLWLECHLGSESDIAARLQAEAASRFPKG